jgi:uncharacterized protein (TIGR02145 family)
MNSIFRSFLFYGILLLAALVTTCKKDDDNTMYDIDGNQYPIITIGTQTWMVKNLKTTTYNDGTPVLHITERNEWEYSATAGYCSYNNDDSHIEKYGLLYNWNAIRTGKLAPKGWHIPTIAEWQTLIDYLIANGYNYDGTTTGNKIAKSLGKAVNWTMSQETGTIGKSDYPEYENKSGFNAMPGGCRDFDFDMMGYGAYWWCLYNEQMDDPYRIDIYYNMTEIFINHAGLTQGFSVRCIKDN